MQCDILRNFNNSRKHNGHPHEERDSPLQVKLIKFLGLKNYFVDKFVFKRKQSKYELAKKNGRNCMLMPKEYEPPAPLDVQVKLLQSTTASIPIILLTHKQPKDRLTVIYSHGNSSDLSDALIFLEAIAMTYGVDVLGYDYSGYGESRVYVIGEETIVRDLELVIGWLDRPLSKIVLWGFSLGSYPTVCNAVTYASLAGIVLQCPIASINCIFQKELSIHTRFTEDHFSNLQRIDKIRCPVFIVHSLEDEIIPICHIRLLYEKYAAKNGKDHIWFLEVNKLKHNAIHRYFVSNGNNDLKQEMREFLEHIKQRKIIELIEPTKRQQDKFKIRETQLDEHDFDEEEFELLTSEKDEVLQPGRKFSQNRRILPRCFD